MADIIKLAHGDTVRLSTWTRFPYDNATAEVSTARGYATKHEDDPEVFHRSTLANGHDTAWTHYMGGALLGDRTARDAQAADIEARLARAITLTAGDVVEIEGERFTVRPAWGNDHQPRNSDPIKFHRICA